MNIWKLILIVLGILYVLAELAYRRWIRPDCGLSEAEMDCEKCKRRCVAPVGSQDGDGFHLGAVDSVDGVDGMDGMTAPEGDVGALGRWL